jgi:hypothetical protein
MIFYICSHKIYYVKKELNTGMAYDIVFYFVFTLTLRMELKGIEDATRYCKRDYSYP